MIQVEIRLYATLSRYRPELKVGEPLPLRIKEKATLKEALIKLGIPPETIQLSLVNGRLQPLDHVLATGDRVALFPPIGGG
jgi:sulfur carrier protein ThiS